MAQWLFTILKLGPFAGRSPICSNMTNPGTRSHRMASGSSLLCSSLPTHLHSRWPNLPPLISSPRVPFSAQKMHPPPPAQLLAISSLLELVCSETISDTIQDCLRQVKKDEYFQNGKHGKRAIKMSIPKSCQHLILRVQNEQLKIQRHKMWKTLSQEMFKSSSCTWWRLSWLLCASQLFCQNSVNYVCVGCLLSSLFSVGLLLCSFTNTAVPWFLQLHV